MQAQRYRHRIELQEKLSEQDSDGAISYTWETVQLDSETFLDAVPAEVLTGPGREFQAANTKQAETTARIKLHWFPGLSPEWRVLWDGKVYDIQSIETDATARREYRLRCRDGVSDGS